MCRLQRAQLLKQLDEQEYITLTGFLEPVVVAGVGTEMGDWVDRQRINSGPRTERKFKPADHLSSHTL